jgi:hypothetical protein
VITAEEARENALTGILACMDELGHDPDVKVAERAVRFLERIQGAHLDMINAHVSVILGE